MVTREGLLLSLNEEGKEGRSKMIASSSYLEKNLKEATKRNNVEAETKG